MPYGSHVSTSAFSQRNDLWPLTCFLKRCIFMMTGFCVVFLLQMSFMHGLTRDMAIWQTHLALHNPGEDSTCSHLLYHRFIEFLFILNQAKFG